MRKIKTSCNRRFELVCHLVELQFRIMFSFSRKISGYVAHTISKRPNVTGNLMPKLRTKKECINQRNKIKFLESGS
jgi:hypothetical protein